MSNGIQTSAHTSRLANTATASLVPRPLYFTYTGNSAFKHPAAQKTNAPPPPHGCTSPRPPHHTAHLSKRARRDTNYAFGPGIQTMPGFTYGKNAIIQTTQPYTRRNKTSTPNSPHPTPVKQRKKQANNHMPNTTSTPLPPPPPPSPRTKPTPRTHTSNPTDSSNPDLPGDPRCRTQDPCRRA